MKTLIKFLFAIAVVSISACTEPIDIELNNEGFDRLVVETWLTTDTIPYEVKLTKSTAYFTEETPPPVNDATVTISDGTSITNLFEVGSTGIYKTSGNYFGEVGKTYKLTIDDNGEVYEAESKLRTRTEIDSLGVEPDEDDPGIQYLSFYGLETPGLGDYYMWLTYVNGELKTPLKEVWFGTDEFVDGNYINGYVFDNVEVFSDDTCTLEMHSITKETYDFLLTLMNTTQWQGGLFDAPPANITTNISNGAVGHFNVSGVHRKTIVVP